ncbi:NAD(P)H-dependent oxidoreductase [Aurantimonas sp. HBX-1]|uniref:NAD(P)H-dependent oxidoreductase n=1 Tax=Aurantimonas sp. HBX-1 TaxID=2906072 RepID=UPI001F36AD6A|nr:NAD(P)H-dependent oxidoreductase [Aurantimonas sp. HBX-1]UIJ71744.1 NAD(P)H-dependent oxidoreductase [Aurantimonas sp. HBX-1]
MPRRILILVGHPDPAPERFCRALAEAYRDGAASAGHSVRVIDLATLDIPFLRSQEAFLHAGVPADLAPASAAIVEAEHIVLIFPLWLGTMPALLKAFLEQTMRPGLAFLYGAGPAGLPKPALAGRSARIVVTMGMPALAYRLWFRDHGIACLRRNILNFVGIKPVRETLFGSVDSASKARRDRWLAAMRKLGTRGI